MIRHLLLAIDGSPLAEAAARRGIELARQIEGRVTVLCVSAPFHAAAYRPGVLAERREEYEGHCRAETNRWLDAVGRMADEQGVECETIHRFDDDIAGTIVALAAERGCDLVVMGSHGRRGLGEIFLGSQTQRVLGRAHVPVLVCRSA